MFLKLIYITLSCSNLSDNDNMNATKLKESNVKKVATLACDDAIILFFIH